MAEFSLKSLVELETCDGKLWDLFKEVIKHYDCAILEGRRSAEKQNEYYRTKRSKVLFPNSKHNYNPSEAVDVAPYPIDWNNTKRFYHFAGHVKATAISMNIKIRWGGDWDSDNDLNDQTFNDLVHFELMES